MFICLLCARITTTRRGSRIRHAPVGGDKRFFLRKRRTKDGDRRHTKTNCKIKKRCSDDIRHAKTNCNINPLVDGGKEPRISWEEWSWIFG